MCKMRGKCALRSAVARGEEQNVENLVFVACCEMQKATINEHIGDIFDDKELFPEACRKKFGISEFQQKAPKDYIKKNF